MSTEALPIRRPAPGKPVRVPRLGFLDLAALLGVLIALYAALALSPAERVQGDTFRIIYVHVPMAWLAYVAFFVVLVGSIGYLWKRSQRMDDLARASAEIGVVFTTLMLATGAIWGRPVWGVWWTWDARLTTTLVMWFIYVGYLMVRSAVSDPSRASRIAAVVGIVGFIDIPIVQLSVTWWRTLHPEPTVTRAGGMPPDMLWVLVVSVLAFSLVYARLLTLRMSLIRAQRDVRDLTQRTSERLEAA